MIELAIVGSGPAALTAAIYAARAGVKVKVFEKAAYGGALNEIEEIHNYPGVVKSGAELAKDMKEQAAAAGAEFAYGEVSEVRSRGPIFELEVDGETVEAQRVLVATGTEPRQLDVQVDKPVSYCALCDGDLVKDKNVVVVGGANSAAHGALYLSNLASHVTVVSHSELRAEQVLADQLRARANIEILENVDPTSELLNRYDHIFVFIGKLPASHCLKNLAATLLDPGTLLNREGYVLTDENNMTVIPGLYAAGDVREGSMKQVITAAGDGALAGQNASNLPFGA